MRASKNPKLTAFLSPFSPGPFAVPKSENGPLDSGCRSVLDSEKQAAFAASNGGSLRIMALPTRPYW